MEDVFVEGIMSKYPPALLKERLAIEGNVVGAFWSDPLMYDETDLVNDDFVTADGQYLFGLGRRLRMDKHLNEFDQAGVMTNIDEAAYKEFELHGGYKGIYKLIKSNNSKNSSVYIDTLKKYNFLRRLHDAGFSVTSPVEDGNGHSVVPIDACRSYDYQTTADWFDALLLRIAKNESSGSNVVYETSDMLVSDEMIEKLGEGVGTGISIGYIDDRDINGNPIRVFPFLDNQIGSLRHGTTNALCGYSSTGKSTLMCQALLALASRGEKILIISNECEMFYYYCNFLSFLAYRKFRGRLPKNVLLKGLKNATDEERELYVLTRDYYNETVAKQFCYVQITDADSNLVKRKIRKAVLEYGCSVVFYDTMKADLNSYGKNEQVYLTLIRDSRMFSELAKRYNLIMLLSLQISSSTKGGQWIDESDISQSKQIIEVLETCLMLRNCYGVDETQESGKHYINPFRRVKMPDGTWATEPYALDPTKNYSLLFVTKNRAGENSERTGEVFVLEADLGIGTFHEVAFACPGRAWLGGSKS